MEATPHQENPRKKQRVEEDCPNGVNHEEPESPSQPEDPQGKALSNHLVLKNTFSFFSPVDLESCRKQCSLWRGVANGKPLNFFHCDIEIQTNQGCKPIITLTKKSQLRRLTLCRSSAFRLADPTNVYRTLSPVANEFGFQLLPRLKVSVGIMKDRSWKAINTTLMSLVECGNVEILELYPK